MELVVPFDLYRDRYTTSKTAHQVKEGKSPQSYWIRMSWISVSEASSTSFWCKQGCGRVDLCDATLHHSVAGSTLSSGLPFTSIRTSPLLHWWVFTSKHLDGLQRTVSWRVSEAHKDTT